MTLNSFEFFIVIVERFDKYYFKSGVNLEALITENFHMFAGV